jgi:2-polyprenyl-3-methyl-5-hydroxy-6-metoxy-1,4-benzoquinol methylase
MKCNICFNNELQYLFSIKKRDQYEIQVKIKSKNFFRKVYFCKKCGSVNLVKKNLDMLRFNKFENKYYNLTLKNKIKEKFNFVRLLPKSSSMNFFRVQRIVELIKLNLKKKTIDTIDIGAGTGIFSYELNKQLKNQEIKLNNYALDSDPNSSFFLKNCSFIKGCYNNLEKLNKKFDLITLNKTLEHIYEPINFLRKIKKILKKDGLLYIEVPDINNTVQVKKDDPVYMSLHHNFYSSKTFLYISKKINLNLLYFKKINEFNKKYTIYGVFSNREFLNI